MGYNAARPGWRRHRRRGIALAFGALAAVTECGAPPAEPGPVPVRRGEVIRPVTGAVLSLMPESAAVAVAVPYPAATVSRWLAFMRETAPDPPAVSVGYAPTTPPSSCSKSPVKTSHPGIPAKAVALSKALHLSTVFFMTFAPSRAWMSRFHACSCHATTNRSSSRRWAKRFCASPNTRLRDNC